MNKISIRIIILLFLPLSVNCQKISFKKTFGEKDKQLIIEKLNELFESSITFSYNITTDDLKSSFSEIKDGIVYDSLLLKEIEDLLNKDKINPFYNYSMANYYKNNGDLINAERYYKIALYSIKMDYFDNDSAYYYSFRGTVANNLGIDNYTKDFEKSLKINPNDSLAIAFYPLALISEGRFDEARAILINSLNEYSNSGSYIFLIAREAYYSYQTAIKYENSTIKPFNEMMDFTLLDKFAQKYKENEKIQKARVLSNIFRLYIKYYFLVRENLKKNKNNSFKEMYKVEYDLKEYQMMDSLIQTIKFWQKNNEINEFSSNNTLGSLYLFQNDYINAEVYYRKAIDLFQEKKRSEYFNTDAVYNALFGIYSIEENVDKQIEILIEKIEINPLGYKNDDDYYKLASSYLKYNDLKNAIKYAKIGYEINKTNPNLLALLGHLYFLDGFSSMTTIYLQDAEKYVETDQKKLDLYILTVGYLVINGNIEDAYNYIIELKENVKKLDLNCDLCNYLLENYIKVGD